MKKILIAVLVLFTLVSLMAGCNKPDNTATPNNGDANLTSPSPSADDFTSPDPSPDDLPSPDPSPTPGTLAYEKGILTATSFESKYLDIRFSLPAGFVMATSEEINAMMELGADVAGINGDILDYAKLTTVYEMVATSSIGFPNVSLLSEKLPLSNMTVTQYFDALKSGLSSVESAAYTFTDGDPVEIAGQTYDVLRANGTMLGVTMNQNYLIRTSGNRMICFIVTYTPDTAEALDTLMNSFSKY